MTATEIREAIEAQTTQAQNSNTVPGATGCIQTATAIYNGHMLMVRILNYGQEIRYQVDRGRFYTDRECAIAAIVLN